MNEVEAQLERLDHLYAHIDDLDDEINDHGFGPTLSIYGRMFALEQQLYRALEQYAQMSGCRVLRPWFRQQIAPDDQGMMGFERDGDRLMLRPMPCTLYNVYPHAPEPILELPAFAPGQHDGWLELHFAQVDELIEHPVSLDSRFPDNPESATEDPLFDERLYRYVHFAQHILCEIVAPSPQQSAGAGDMRRFLLADYYTAWEFRAVLREASFTPRGSWEIYLPSYSHYPIAQLDPVPILPASAPQRRHHLTLDRATRFAELRSLVSGRASPEAFEQICQLVDAAEESAEPTLDYLERHLASWPENIPRRAPRRWVLRWFDEKTTPGLRLCSSLHCESVTLGAEQLGSITSSPDLRNMRRLYLGYNAFEGELLDLLVRSPHLQNLERLALESSELDIEALLELFEEGCLPRLTHLGWGSNAMTPKQARMLANSSLAEQLVELDLARCKLGAPGLAALLPRGAFANLRRLDLDHNMIDRLGLETLAQSGILRSLELLSLDTNLFGDEAIESLLQSPDLAHLRSLRLGFNKLEDVTAKALAACPHLANLRELDLYYNPITEQGVLALARSPYLSNLRSLCLHAEGLGERALQALAHSPYLHESVRAQFVSLLGQFPFAANATVPDGQGEEE